METIEIKPGIGIGKIKFGMTRDDVFKVMGSDYHSFERGNTNIDAFYSCCLQVNYDDNYKVDFIEIARDILVIYKVFYDGINIFETKAEELVKQIDKFSEYDRDNWETKSGYSYIFKGIGLSLWRSNVFKEEVLQEEWFEKLSQEEKDDEMKYRFFESAGLAVKGYWD